MIPNTALSRRQALGGATLLAALAPTGAQAESRAKPRPASGQAAPFLWGVATAGHQVEGGNVGSDIWLLETVKPTVFAEPSGDACDAYHRYREDIGITADLGLNAWRMGVEWARIEPEPGLFSQAALDHYERIVDYALERGLAPFLTLHHFASPRWLAAQGGFEVMETADRYAAYAERVGKALGDRLAGAVTFNEPNVVQQVTWSPTGYDLDARTMAVFNAMLQSAARACGSDKFSTFLYGDMQTLHPTIMRAHALGVQALKAGPGRYPVGISLAMGDEQGVGEGNLAERKKSEVYEPWLRLAAEHGDFVGVQTYTRALVGPRGNLPPPPGAELTAAQYEFYPEALEATIAYAARVSGKPIYVTENGVAAHDDARRVAYIDRALDALARARKAGADVRGYFHWSLLDCYEWLHGYSRPFGLVAVDRETFVRTPKPSARRYAQRVAEAR
ncbi:glycoside hydrolase family 1 protein [Caulobacter sp. RHG1]|uniref:glycoside hydrolase family 1 protein n=1 Tax=Caulobacter sp. (strain RHG1) TaxID=2545762 RepID=UPI0015521E3B|nr:family 1 glycosylhydrolase [Caulobacter sp. RHG1]NQE64014.1 beta-galactosidase [Caulobacter sp. RHG1]